MVATQLQNIQPHVQYRLKEVGMSSSLTNLKVYKLYLKRISLTSPVMFALNYNWLHIVTSIPIRVYSKLTRRRQWHHTPILLPGKPHGWRCLVGYSPWGHEESDTTDFTFTFHFHALEKEMATHSSVLAWRIPGTGEPGGCRLWGRTESDTT